MTITRNFKLYLNAGTASAPYINVNQYDEGEEWVFTLYNEDGSTYTPSTGAIIGIKSDGNAIMNSGSVVGGKVVITETEQMTAASGRAIYELLIDNATHGTANFIVNVERRPSDDAEFSDSDLSMLQEAIDSAAEIEDLLGGQDVPTVITPIISDWLDENITNPSNPPIDTSLTVAGAAADAKATGDRIGELQGDFDDIAESTEVQTEITPSDLAGGYIGSDRYTLANPSGFSVKYIPVVAGKKYRITADQIRTLSADYGIVAFSSETPANQVMATQLINGSTTNISVDYTYNAVANGFLGVAIMLNASTELHFYNLENVYHVITDKTLSLADVPADAKETGDRFDLLGYGETEKSDEVSAKYVIDDRYITSGGRISSAGLSNFKVAWYPVKMGKEYTISGMARVGGSGQALVCFDNVYDSTVGHVCKTVLQTATTTETEYNISYTPTEDGYIVMPKIDMNKLVVTLVSDVDFQRIYDIEKDIESIEAEIGRVKDAVKIQLFGDSITDNQWGDRITWANYIAENMRDYTVTVVNDAVGGSGIGHGKSSGTTDSHQTEEYNYVYDLVTDGTTLQTDANAIVVLVGTNNWASGTALGDMSSTGYSTIYGALKGILEYISQHTSAVVFVCTIPQRYNSTDQSRSTNAYGEPLNPSGVSLADYCEAFRQVSAFYGMPCVHLNEALGWNRLNISNYSGDGLHPNVTGDKMVAKFICSEIKKHI